MKILQGAFIAAVFACGANGQSSYAVPAEVVNMPKKSNRVGHKSILSFNLEGQCHGKSHLRFWI